MKGAIFELPQLAASVSQFNENSTYLVEVSAALKDKTCLDVLGKYAAKYTLIRLNQSKRFSTVAYRRNRRNKKKKVKTLQRKTKSAKELLMKPELECLMRKY